MPNIFYREDDRNLHEISNAGFEAWVQLELPDVKLVVTRFNGVYTAPILLKEKRAKWLSDAVFKFNRQTLNLSTLGVLIKTKVDRSSVQISTGITDEGGGRAKKHLFKIRVPGTIPLYLVNLKTGGFQRNPPSFKVLVEARLVMDAPKVADANHIGIAISGGEVAFLTRIPRDWISQIS